MTDLRRALPDGAPVVLPIGAIVLVVLAIVGYGPLVEGEGRAMRPALAAIEEGHCPALVMDELHDGRLVLFVPDSPASMSGSIHIVSPDKVVLLDVPLMPFMKVIASWGLGFRELVEMRQGEYASGTGRRPDQRRAWFDSGQRESAVLV